MFRHLDVGIYRDGVVLRVCSPIDIHSTHGSPFDGVRSIRDFRSSGSAIFARKSHLRLGGVVLKGDIESNRVPHHVGGCLWNNLTPACRERLVPSASTWDARWRPAIERPSLLRQGWWRHCGRLDGVSRCGICWQCPMSTKVVRDGVFDCVERGFNRGISIRVLPSIARPTGAAPTLICGYRWWSRALSAFDLLGRLPRHRSPCGIANESDCVVFWLSRGVFVRDGQSIPIRAIGILAPSRESAIHVCLASRRNVDKDICTKCRFVTLEYNTCEGGAVLERIFPNARYAIRYGNARKADAALKHILLDIRQPVAYRHARQVGASQERGVFEVGHGVGDCHARQSTAGERIESNERNAGWNRHARQPRASREHSCSDYRHGVRYRHARKSS